MKTHLAAMLLAASLPTNAQFGNIDIGKAFDIGKRALQAKEAARDFSPEEEVALGEAVTAGFLGAAPLWGDDVAQRYVNRVGKWLALHCERADLPWTFGVIDTDTINAFAMPGGNVLISKGLLRRLANESELAGVLAHEIAHVVKKHQLTAMKSGAWGELASSIGKEYAADRIARSGGGVAGQVAKNWGAGVAADLLKDGFFLRPLDRSMEYEADQLAVVIATRSGYDPYGLVAALQMLAQYKGDGDAASIFSTHPAAADRIGELEKFVPTVERYATQPQLLEVRFKQIVK